MSTSHADSHIDGLNYVDTSMFDDGALYIDRLDSWTDPGMDTSTTTCLCLCWAVKAGDTKAPTAR